MKHKRRTAVLLVALTVLCTLGVTLSACNKDKHTVSDPETRPFSMAISTPDEVFNPFFSTSGIDSEIIGMTQIAMLNTDIDGLPVAGDNEPTVVKDYTINTRDEEVAGGGTKKFTTYEFLIKNGIKWSNGSDLTIKDVLFNLYVYLDPVYTGSATIYSTDIVGLQAYRQQDPDASDTGASSFDSQFVATANTRIGDDIDMVKVYSSLVGIDDKPTLPDDFDYDKGLLDVAYVAKTFYEELLSDWNAINKEDYKDWGFTEKWQIFMLNDDGDDYFLERERHGDITSPYFKDNNGNYKLNEEYSNEFFNENLGPYLKEKGFARENGGLCVLIPQTTEEGKKALDKAIGSYCVEYAFRSKFTYDFPIELVKRTDSRITWKDNEKDKVETALRNINPNNFEIVVRYWATATTVLDKFTAEAKTAYFKTNGRLVKTIEGIKTRKESHEFNGKNLSEEYDVLIIKINDIDPKAILNFGFTVSPMYNYSSENWRGKNYIADFDYEEGEIGLEFGDSDFMTEVVNAPSKIGLPVGGGAYMARGGSSATAKTFFSDNIVEYERNPYFYTLFGNDRSKNAKIKYVRYKVVESDQIVNSLTGGNIDYGEPSAKVENKTLLDNKGLITKAIMTNGYGYVGINPRFIPDVNVRRAIIKALNAARIMNDYYKGGFAQELYRPMSQESWAYPWAQNTTYTSKSEEQGGIGIYGTSYAYDSTGNEIDRLLEKDYVKGSDGIYKRRTPLKGFGEYKLSYKFTIAGSSTDHPAYKLFLEAATLLKNHGFDIRVVTSQTALSDLSAGKLEVWAAAWSSSVDPDMYQVYHMESQASSVKNWGYPQILGRTNADAWGDELEVIEKLSEAIERGRATDNTQARINAYAQALNWVMELACEFPIYQRKDLFAYQNGLLNPSTLPKNISSFSGLLARIWEVNYYTE